MNNNTTEIVNIKDYYVQINERQGVLIPNGVGINVQTSEGDKGIEALIIEEGPTVGIGNMIDLSGRRIINISPCYLIELQ